MLARLTGRLSMSIVPESISSKLPVEGVQFYEGVFYNSYSRHSDDVLAHQVAWAATRSKMREVDGGLVANSMDFAPVQLFTFDLEENSEVVVMNHDNGEVELDISLAHTGPNLSGRYFAEEDLQFMADQINSEGSSLPDINHEILSKLRSQFGDNPEVLANAIKKEKGIFKSVKAVVHQGKLWIKAFLDQRYKNYADNFKKVSIEAIGKVDKATGRVVKPLY